MFWFSHKMQKPEFLANPTEYFAFLIGLYGKFSLHFKF